MFSKLILMATVVALTMTTVVVADGAIGATRIIDFTKFKVASSAMNSVELNPDHKGFSVSVGTAAEAGHYAAAVGVMYGYTKINPGCEEIDIGINIKAYSTGVEYTGASVGLTVGF